MTTMTRPADSLVLDDMGTWDAIEALREAIAARDVDTSLDEVVSTYDHLARDAAVLSRLAIGYRDFEQQRRELPPPSACAQTAEELLAQLRVIVVDSGTHDPGIALSGADMYAFVAVLLSAIKQVTLQPCAHSSATEELGAELYRLAATAKMLATAAGAAAAYSYRRAHSEARALAGTSLVESAPQTPA